jgi:hypothetical protein
MTTGAALLLAFASCAAPVSPTMAAEPGAPGVRVVEAVAPEYPDIAKQARITGTFKVRVSVGSTGEPACAELVDPLMPLIKAVTEGAALQWRFAPATREELAQGAERAVTLTFVFRLLEPAEPAAGLLPRFRPPYSVEIRGRSPETITLS